MEAPVTAVDLGHRNAGAHHQRSSGANPFAPRSRVVAASSVRNRGEADQGDREQILPGFVQPGQLACADVILTSYSVVQRELQWAEVVAERQAGRGDRPGLRVAQRYLCRPSPLTCVRWWRVSMVLHRLIYSRRSSILGCNAR